MGKIPTMTKLSVNINKIATIRNARGGNTPDLLKAASDIELFGAEGITVHPRPDERHIRYQDARDLKNVVQTEYNIEGNPTQEFIDLVLSIIPDQVTLVPDSPDAITSNAGWNVIENHDFLLDVISRFKSAGIRTSIFMETDEKQIEAAAKVGTDRIELYTEYYASTFLENRELAISPYIKAASAARKYGLQINACHDLNLDNLNYFHRSIDGLAEVSIGHALVSDALYLGLENTVNIYQRALDK
jgi:pyridoxine 5-phosphate synthase